MRLRKSEEVDLVENPCFRLLGSFRETVTG